MWDLQALQRCRFNSPRPLPARSLLTNKGSVPPKYKSRLKRSDVCSECVSICGQKWASIPPVPSLCRWGSSWWAVMETSQAELIFTLAARFVRNQPLTGGGFALDLLHSSHLTAPQSRPERKGQIMWPDFNAAPGVGGANLLRLCVCWLLQVIIMSAFTMKPHLLVFEQRSKENPPRVTSRKNKSLPPLTFDPWVWGKAGKMIIWCKNKEK